MHPHGHADSDAHGVHGSPGKLNVILHGLFVFRETSGGIQVLIPHLGNSHAYRAGNWMAETSLQGGHYVLKGATPGKAGRFSRNVNIVLPRRSSAPMGHDHGVVAVIDLPYPDAMVSLGRIPLNPAKDLGGDDKPKIRARAISTVQVLTYSFPNDAALKLGNHYWEPVMNSQDIINLHIYAEPERPPDHGHMRMAFQVAAALVMGASITLRRPPGTTDLAAEADQLPAGVHLLELEDLVQRQRRLQALGEAVRRGDASGLNWNRIQGFAGGNPENCPSGLVEMMEI